MKQNTIFETLGKLQVSDKTQKKGRFSYLSWAWAWHILKQNYPDAQRKVYENPEGVPYFTDGKFANVKVGIIINGLEHIDYLPITDNSNRSIPLVKITSFQMNIYYNIIDLYYSLSIIFIIFFFNESALKYF